MNGNMRWLAGAVLAVVMGTGCGGAPPVADLEDCRAWARADMDRYIESQCAWSDKACYYALEPAERVVSVRLDQAECLDALEKLRRYEGG